MNISFKSRMIRGIVSLLPRVGLLPGPARPQGVSALLRVLNERDWLEGSINSLKDHVDEIIAVDTGSTDGSLEILNRMAADIKKLKVYSFPDCRPWEFNNFALKKSSYRWMLKWDADIVTAQDAGQLRPLMEYIRGLDPRGYYYISPKLVEVTGDFYHQFPNMRVRGDMELFTYSDAARYIRIERTFSSPPYPVKLPPKYLPPVFSINMDALKIPLYYKLLPFDRVVAFHVNIKPGTRHLLGYFFLQWLASENFRQKQTLEDYAKEQAVKGWGFKDLSSAAEFFMREYVKHLEKYDPALGELPENVRALADKSPYRVVYEDGKPAGRVG